MRVVVIGTGKLARLRAATLVANEHVSWLGIASASQERALDAAALTGASAGGTVERMLAEAPDAVLIASATARHAEDVRACLALRRPVFCEKPIASTVGEAADLVAELTASGVELQVGFDRRFDPALSGLRTTIVSGQLGALQSLALTSHDRDPPGQDFAAASGGMFLDLHIHDFDLARWLTGEEVADVTSVAARRGPCEFLDALGDVDTTAIVLRMADGLPVTIRGSRQDRAGYMMRTELVASTGSATVTDGRYADYRERFTAALVAETHAFVEFAAGRLANPCPASECVAAMLVAAAAQRSSAERRTVSVER